MTAKSTADQGQSQGPAVDRQGAPVVDPTDNVQKLVDAAIKRLDDIQNLNTTHLKELQTQSDAHARLVGDMRAAHQLASDTMRAMYEDKLRMAESQRIDAIRTVDVSNVQRASEVAGLQAGALATQVATSAETLRGQVAAAASAASASLATALGPIQVAVESLRQAQYQQQGERSSKTEDRGSNQWVISLIIGAVFSLVSLGVGIAIAVTK